MEIYIVTAGSYSDYHIKNVFTDREKAQKYVELHGNDPDVPEIEIYETIESNIGEINCISIYYEVKNGESNYKFKILSRADFEDSKFQDNHTYYSIYAHTESISIGRRIYSKDYNEEKLKNKYEKVCYDLLKQVHYLQSMGMSTQEINEVLGNKADEVIGQD